MIVSIVRVATLSISCVIFYATCYAVPMSEWSQEEKRWVENARALYREQGIDFTNEQAESAIDKIRQKHIKGIPKSEWTASEICMINEVRALHEKQGHAFTDEQAQLAVQGMREKLAKFAGSMGALQVLSRGGISAAPGILQQTTHMPVVQTNEDQLAAQLAKLPLKRGDLTISARRDGFDINGKAYVDPEGKIVAFSYDVLSGDITYMAKSPTGLVIKATRAGFREDAIVIATAVQSEAGWDVQTVTGKRLAGYALSMLPSGFMVARESAAFWYEPGRGIRNIVAPDGYLFAPIQRGNVGATKCVLLEKENADGGNNQLIKLFSSIKDLGAVVGITKKEDYVMLNVDTGALYPFNMQASGKNIQKMSDCKKRNMFINECRKMISYESLYNEDGSKNATHYFWRTHWLRTANRSIAVSMENGCKDVFVTDLETGQKVVALHRALGINWFNVEQRGDGSVKIVAGMGFGTQEIADAESLLNNEPVAGRETTGSSRSAN